MKVVAIKTGWDGENLRHPGDIFTIPGVSAFSKKWMIPIEAALRAGRSPEDSGEKHWQREFFRKQKTA